MIDLTCFCGAKLKVADAAVGKRVKCSSCGESLQVSRQTGGTSFPEQRPATTGTEAGVPCWFCKRRKAHAGHWVNVDLHRTIASFSSFNVFPMGTKTTTHFQTTSIGVPRCAECGLWHARAKSAWNSGCAGSVLVWLLGWCLVPVLRSADARTTHVSDFFPACWFIVAGPGLIYLTYWLQRRTELRGHTTNGTGVYDECVKSYPALEALLKDGWAFGAKP